MSLRLPVVARPGLRVFLHQARIGLPSRAMITAMIAALLLASLAGCTTYTYDDGHKETVWGVPPVDEHKTEQERQNEGVKYREPGVIPEE